MNKFILKNYISIKLGEGKSQEIVNRKKVGPTVLISDKNWKRKALKGPKRNISHYQMVDFIRKKGQEPFIHLTASNYKSKAD